jgi:hypothetical protein
MLNMRTRCHYLLCAFSALGLTGAAVPAHAQSVANATPAVAVTGGVDVVNEYMFRGIRQNGTEIAVRPSAGAEFTVHSGAGLLRRVGLGLGFWNSLHTGDTGSRGPSGRMWYEADLQTTLWFEFGRGASVAAAYTAYTSPNEMFDTMKEVAVTLAFDDRTALGGAALKPYALFAFEVDTASAVGQADGGLHAGRYLELGITPAHRAGPAVLSIPIKLGVSLRDYYELAGEDHPFGFASVGAMAAFPLPAAAILGRWEVHGGVEYQRFGETTRTFNAADTSAVIGSIGMRISR